MAAAMGRINMAKERSGGHSTHRHTCRGGPAQSAPGLPAGQRTHRRLPREQVLLERLAEPGSDNGHMDLALILILDDRSKDDVGGGVSQGGDHLGHAVDLLQREVLAAGDVVHDACGALDGALDQRCRSCGLQEVTNWVSFYAVRAWF